MTRRLLPVLLSMTLPGLLSAVAAAAAQDHPAAGASGGQGQGQTGQAKPASPATKTDGRIALTRSDGSTVYTRPPDPKEIRKLVGYMRDGMNRADRADKQRQTRRVQNKRK
jgi:hypothetical protein